MIDPKTEKETHMVWDGYTDLEDAKKEYQSIRELSLKGGVKPLDGYVYEAEKPLYGNVETKLDMAELAKQYEETISLKDVSQNQLYEIITND